MGVQLYFILFLWIVNYWIRVAQFKSHGGPKVFILEYCRASFDKFLTIQYVLLTIKQAEFTILWALLAKFKTLSGSYVGHVFTRQSKEVVFNGKVAERHCWSPNLFFNLSKNFFLRLCSLYDPHH